MVEDHHDEVGLQFIEEDQPDEVSEAEGESSEVVDVEVLRFPVVVAIRVSGFPHFIYGSETAERHGKII